MCTIYMQYVSLWLLNFKVRTTFSQIFLLFLLKLPYFLLFLRISSEWKFLLFFCRFQSFTLLSSIFFSNLGTDIYHFECGLFSFQLQIGGWQCVHIFVSWAIFFFYTKTESVEWILATPDCHYSVEFIAWFRFCGCLLLKRVSNWQEWERWREEKIIKWYNRHKIEANVDL